MNELEKVCYEDLESWAMVLEEGVEEAVEALLHLLEVQVKPSTEYADEWRAGVRRNRNTYRKLKRLLIKAKQRRGLEYEDEIHADYAEGVTQEG